MFARVHKNLNLHSLIFIILVLVLKAPTVWGFSVSTTHQYQEMAKKESLWNDPKWIYLGHYNKNFFGYSSGFRGLFFIHPEGFDSPEKELLTTIEALFSDSSELTQKYGRHPQCQFLARRKWLIDKLHIHPENILPCEERTKWKKQLGTTSVTLIFASSDLGNPASSFGHTFLKLINPANAKNKDLIDYGVNYAADADASEGFFYALKGLFGFYDGRFTMLPYHQKIREYINLEGRDIWEYPLALTIEEVDELIDHLLELDNSASPYYFFSKNCSYQILSVLDAIRPDFQLSHHYKAWAIPIDTVKTIRQKTNLILETKYKQSLKTSYLEAYSNLNTEQQDVLNTMLDSTLSTYTIPANTNLTGTQKAEIYETGLKYLSVKAYRTQIDLDEEKYKMALQRASLGPSTKKGLTKQSSPPDQSHDSSAFYLGYGKNILSEYSSFKFRAAFHDLEQNDAGTVPFSQNNFGAFELRYYSEIKKLSLESFTFLNLISTNPTTPLDKNFSWKVRLDILDQFRPDFEMGGGLSFDLVFLKNSRISYFATSRYLKTENPLLKNSIQIGPEILFITRPLATLGLSLQLAYFSGYQNIPYLRFSTKLNYQLEQNFDLQLLANDQKNYQINFVKNFIF